MNFYLTCFILIPILPQFISENEFFENLFKESNDSECSNFKRMVDLKKLSVRSQPFSTFSVKISNFNSFNQLNLDCFAYEKFFVLEIDIIPNKLIVLENNDKLAFKFLKANDSQLSILFVFFKGIDVNFNLFKSNPLYNQNLLIFKYFQLNLFSNGSKVKFCNEISTPFRNVQSLYFTLTVKYFESTCPFLFNDTYLDYLALNGLCDTFLRKNKLGFLNMNGSNINKIETVLLNFFNFKLSKKLISKQIFMNTSFLRLEGTLKSIDAEPFNQLDNLKSLQIFLKNLNVLVSHDATWINKFQNKFKIELSFSDEYLFQNQNLCLFKSFTNSVNIDIKRLEIVCTCTIMYLWSHSKSLKFLPSQCFYFKHECNFTQLMSACNKNFVIKYKDDLYDYYYKSEMISFVNLVLIPLFCLLGLLTNGLSILILIYGKKMNSTNEKKSSRDLIQLMLFNSILNFIYSFIYFFHMANICIFFDGIFCSLVKRTYFFQLVEKYLIEFIGNSIKTCTNIVCVLIAKNRLSLLNGEKKKISFLKKIIAIIALLIISILVNVESIFTIEINSLKFLIKNDYLDFPIKNTFNNVLKKSFQKPYLKPLGILNNYDPIYFALFFLKFFINDIFLYFLNVIIDILLIYRLRKFLNQKLAASINQNNKKKIFEQKYLEYRTTLAVVFNCFFLLIFRFLELSISAFVFYRIIGSVICDTLNIICNNFYHLGSLVYLISCSFNIVIYSYFNFEFRKTVDDFFNLLKLKFF